MPICKSCQHQFEGIYCNQCGEKVLNPSERTVKHFLKEIFSEYTSIDNKFLKSFYLLIRHPGQLSYNYRAGIRKHYIKLLTLFFIGNLIYFLFIPVETFNTSFESQFHAQRFSNWIEPMIETKLNTPGLDKEAFIAAYNIQSTSLAKLLIILLIPLTAVPIGLLFYSSKRYVADHLYLATEYNVFNIYVNVILMLPILIILILLGRLLGLPTDSIQSDFGISMIILFNSFWFFLFAAKRYYQEKWWLTLIKTLLFCCTLYPVLLIYRLILFWMTWWTM